MGHAPARFSSDSFGNKLFAHSKHKQMWPHGANNACRGAFIQITHSLSFDDDSDDDDEAEAEEEGVDSVCFFFCFANTTAKFCNKSVRFFWN